MLTNFETITEDLTEYEINKVMPVIAAGLSTKLGKQNAINGNAICKKVNESNCFNKYTLKPVRLRKIIGAIRLTGKLMYLCSSAKGYYLANDIQELDECIDSLEQRIAQQQRVVDALIWQKNQVNG